MSPKDAPVSGLLGQLTDLQRKLAFEHIGSVNSWDEDVPLDVSANRSKGAKWNPQRGVRHGR